MYRQIIILTFCLMAVSSDTKIQKIMKDGLASLGAQCLPENVDVTAADLEELVIRMKPSSGPTMCLLACIHKKIGMQDEQGKLRNEGVLNFLDALKQEDIDNYQFVREHFLDCLHAVPEDNDECIVAEKYSDCVVTGGLEKGILD